MTTTPQGSDDGQQRAPDTAATLAEASTATAAAGVPKLPFDLQQNEYVILFTRRHWVYLWPRLVFHALVGLVPVVILLIFVQPGSLGGNILGIIELIWLGYWAMRAFFDWYSYKHDIWVVTNQRIIDAIKPNLIRSRLASADLVDVEDIAVEQQGLLPTLFHFGSVRCQTAGERPNFTLTGVSRPTRILAVVDAARDAARRDTRAGWR